MNHKRGKVLLILLPDVNVIEPFRSASKKHSPMILGFPLGLGYIASYLRKHGNYEVRIFDAIQQKSTIEDILRVIRDYDPLYIGMTTYTVNIKVAVELAKNIKKNWGNSKIVIAGGPHASDDYQNLLTNYPYFDYVVIGEGESTALELLQKLDLQEGGPIETVPGIAYIDPESKAVRVTKPRKLGSVLDDYPYPARDLVDFNQYIFRENILPHQAEIMTSRGCTHRCIFCSFQKNWRARSNEAVIQEMKDLIAKYPSIRSFMIFDDNFSANKKRVVDLCQKMIAHGLHRYQWSCLCRVDQVDREMLDWMKKARCSKIAYGLESADPAILKALNKRIDLETAIKNIELTTKIGINALVYLIIGSPGETLETINTTYRVAKKLKCPAISWSIMQILPGTALAKMRPQEDFVAYLYEPEVSHPNGTISANVPTFENPGMNREQIKQIHRKILRKITFYKVLRHPTYAIKKLSQTPFTVIRICLQLVGLARK
jgi:anaerobic magnesium-protoporphyrin IX monomethyl ester cyclase